MARRANGSSTRMRFARARVGAPARQEKSERWREEPTARAHECFSLASAREHLLEDAVELVEIRVADHDFALALLVAHLAARAIAAVEPRLEAANPRALAVGRGARRARIGSCLQRAYQRLRLPHAQLARTGLLGELRHARLGGRPEQRSGMALAEVSGAHQLADLFGQLQQPQRVGQGRTVAIEQ